MPDDVKRAFLNQGNLKIGIAGEYVITFDPAFKVHEVPAIVGSLTGWDKDQNTLDNVIFPDLSVSTATALTGNKNGHLDSRTFSFIAMGEVD